MFSKRANALFLIVLCLFDLYKYHDQLSSPGSTAVFGQTEITDDPLGGPRQHKLPNNPQIYCARCMHVSMSLHEPSASLTSPGDKPAA